MQREQVGPYRVEAVLGEGPRGERLRATDTRDGRAVVLDLLPAALSADPGYRARFAHDAGLAARLDEPDVVPVQRSGELDGRLFLERPLVPGRDLAAVLAEEGALDPARAVSLVGQVARALDTAHAAGLAHGDLTAADVLLTGADGPVAVTGLGVPRPGGEPADPRADVAALARLLHECLTGAGPVPGGGGAPPAARPEVPPALDAVVRTGLGEAPGRGYADCGELAAAARAALEEPGGSPPAGGGRNPRPLAIVLAGVAVAAVLALVLVVVLGGSGDEAGSAEGTPTATRLVTTTPSPPPDDEAEDRLRSIIPGDFIAVDCDPGEPTDDGAVAVLGCGSASTQPGPEDSVFYLYEDGATLDEVFLADVERNGVPPLPDGASCPDAQGHGSYAIDDERAGRLACYIDEDNDAIMIWTQDGFAAEALAVIVDGGRPGMQALWDWWLVAEQSGFAPR
ncbi:MULTISPECIES: protein kinase domain-containing protein [unclassified Blastococcus]